MAQVNPGQVWKEGVVRFQVLTITNQQDTVQFPKTVVYENLENGNLFSQKLEDFLENKKFLHEGRE